MEYVTYGMMDKVRDYYLRKYPEAKVLAERYENSVIVQTDEAVYVANVTVSYDDEFTNNDQTQAMAEKQLIDWLNDNPDTIQADTDICFDHVSLKIYGGGKWAIIRRHKNCFNN